MNELGTRSVFEIIEEQKIKPEIFGWVKCTPLFTYDPSDFLYEGALTIASQTGILKKFKYVLTFSYFIKYKVLILLSVSLKTKISLFFI